MIKKLLTNLLVRKALVFCGALAVSVAVMCSLMAGRHEADNMSALFISAPNTFFSEDVGAAVLPGNDRPTAQAQTYFGTLPGGYPNGYAGGEGSAESGSASEDISENTILSELSEFVYVKEIPLSLELQQHTYEQCKLHGLDYGLVLALMWRESRFMPEAVNINENGTKDNGIMQINDVNKDWLSEELGITDLMDPVQNITAGTAMLGRFTERYGEHNALMAYQYGEKGMEEKLSQGITTNDLIQIVYSKKSDFEELLVESIG